MTQAVPAPSDLVASVEGGLSDIYQGDEALTTGIASAGVHLVSEISSDLGDFFKAVSDTLSGNPKIVAYFVGAATAYWAYSYYRKYRARKRS
jgi:hypothetical protein